MPIFHPVSLMRLVKVDDIEEVTSRIPRNLLWVEEKHDGWLVQTIGSQIWSRRGIELTENFPTIAKALSKIQGRTHLIGELVWTTSYGVQDQPTISSLAEMDPEEAVEEQTQLDGYASIYFFDLLGDGRDRTKLPLQVRRKLLERTLPQSRFFQLTAVFPFDQWPDVLELSQARGGEGVVFKNIESLYQWRELGEGEPRPVGVWFKMKTGLKAQTDDFVVFSLSRGPRGKLIASLGQYANGKLYHVSNLSNFSADLENEFVRKIRKGPFTIEAGFQERTADGRLRNPTFVRFREDKSPRDVLLPDQYQKFLSPVSGLEGVRTFFARRQRFSFQPTLEEIRVFWQDILLKIASWKEPVTTTMIADEFGIDKRDAWVRLSRMAKWTMLSTEGSKEKRFHITPYGLEVARIIETEDARTRST